MPAPTYPNVPGQGAPRPAPVRMGRVPVGAKAKVVSSGGVSQAVKVPRSYALRPTQGQPSRVSGPAARSAAPVLPKPAPRPAVKPAPKPVAPTHAVVVQPDGSVHVTPHITSPNTRAVKPVKPARPASPATTSSATPVAPQQTDQQWAQQLADTLLGSAQTPAVDALNQNAAARQAAITGYTQSLAQLMNQYGPEAAQAYGDTEAKSAAINGAVAGQLTGAGNAASSELAAKLNAAGQNNSLPVASGLANFASGAANAGYAKGSAQTDALVGQEAAARNYGAKLPGIAGLAGLDATKQLQGQTEQQVADTIAQFAAKRPDLIYQLMGQRQTNRNQQRTNDLTAAAFGLKAQNQGFQQGATKARLSISAQNANTAAQRAADARSNAKTNLTLRQRSIGVTEKRLKLQIAKELSKERTAGQYLGIGARAYQEKAAVAGGLARNAYRGVTDGKGVYHPPISWQQYLTIGMGEKIPQKILIEQGRKVFSKRDIKLGLIQKGK